MSCTFVWPGSRRDAGGFLPGFRSAMSRYSSERTPLQWLLLAPWITVTTPASAPGPVDVSVSLTDGGYWLFPQDYSYGPSIVEIRPGGQHCGRRRHGHNLRLWLRVARSGGQAPGFRFPWAVTSYNHSYLPQPYEQTTPYYPFPLEAFQYTLLRA